MNKYNSFEEILELADEGDDIAMIDAIQEIVWSEHYIVPKTSEMHTRLRKILP